MHAASIADAKLASSTGIFSAGAYSSLIRAYRALWEASHNEAYAERATRLARTVLHEAGSRPPRSDPQEDAETFLALAEYARASGDQEIRNARDELAQKIKPTFLKRRIDSAHIAHSPAPTILETATLLHGFALAGDLEFTNTLARALLEFDDSTAASAATAEKAAALARLPLPLRATPLFKDALARSLARLLALQYTEDSAYFFTPPAARRSLGMIRSHPQRSTFSPSATANFILAGIRYLELKKTNP
jgi:hypothetical protein